MSRPRRVTLLFLSLFALPAYAQILQMVGGQTGKISGIAETAEAVWIGSASGLYAAGSTERLERLIDQPILGVAAVQDTVVVSTGESCYLVSPLRPNAPVTKESIRVTKVPGITGQVLRADALDGPSFVIATSDGVFFHGSGATARIATETARTSVATPDGRFAFIASATRLYRIAADGSQRTLDLANITALATLRDELLIALPDRVDACNFELDLFHRAHDGAATALTRVGDIVYAATKQGVYVLHRDGQLILSNAANLPADGNPGPAVRRIVARGSWVVADREGAEPLVHFYSGATTPTPLGFRGSQINAVAVQPAAPHTHGQSTYIYAATDKGLFAISPNVSNDRWKNVAPNVKLSDVRVSGSAVWAIGTNAVYRYLPDYRIVIDLEPVEPSTAHHMLGGLFLAAGMRVSGQVKPVFRYQNRTTHETIDPPVFALTLRDSKGFGEVLEIDPRKKSTVSVPAESGTTMEYDLKDAWGNEVIAEKLPGRFYPKWIVSGAAGVLLWVAALCLLVVFAPMSLVVNALLMNRWVRNYGFLNFVTVLAAITPVRKHLLRRYLNRLEEDVPPDPRYVVPSPSLTPANIIQRTQEKRFLYIRGESGIGKTALVRNVLRTMLLADTDFIPVFISLRQQRASRPDEAVAAQLQSYGQVTDAELAAELLKHGSFLFVFDGLNEVSDERRDLINEFVHRHKGTSSFLFTSQVDFDDLEGPRMVLERFDENKANEFLCKRLDAGRAAIAQQQVTESTMHILGVPQELEMFARVIERGRKVEPLNRLHLYDAVTEPVRERLENDGKFGVWNALAERSFEATTSAQAVDFTDAALRDATGPLRETGLLVQNGDDLLFRHEQVQGYLASIHFAPRWRQILHVNDDQEKGSPRPGYRWLPMLRFTMSRLEPAERQQLLDALATLDSGLASDVNRNWVQETETAMVPVTAGVQAATEGSPA